MVFFTSRNRIKNLPLFSKLWMTVVAYFIKYSATIITYLADRFDERVVFEIINNEKLERGLR